MNWKLGVHPSVLELGGAKVADVPILAHLPCTSSSIARRWFDLSCRALGAKYTPGGSTNKPNLVWVGWSPPEIWRFKLAKMAILRRLTTHCRRMQKIGLSDLSKILYNSRGTSPLAMGEIKMGVQAGVSELGGAKDAWGTNFGAFAVHFVVYWAKVVWPILSCFAAVVCT